ncbi:hypothetical protein RKE25_14675 [Dyella sp. BiH032]|uniref:hypothetical protein n=1 Tax=Dyella sp. BiH032 TaxID=3075430 RepID=UPI002892BAC0|nr:hypothetical protein [Dyella sp. BiH032]WNL44663.1 hypothetical protein RKE25_14675 [Dyella sp. BiH032]
MSFAPTRVSFRQQARVSLSRGLLGWALLAGVALALPQPATAGVFVSVNIAPPPLPVYVQPPIPAPGYLWVPGYWAYDDDGGYYWVPGTWVLPPFSGALWTPAWWGWDDGVYVFHSGYWGPHVGFYGGINYGFGYTGVGYAGGYWDRDRFYYNRSVNHITTNITNVYNKTVINNVTVNRISYNGGPGGTAARATPQELQAERMQRSGPIAAQRQQMTQAAQNHDLRAQFNHGAPAIAATPRPGAFAERGITAAHGAPIAPRGPAAAPNIASPRAPEGAVPSASFAPHGGRGAPIPQPRTVDAGARPMNDAAPRAGALPSASFGPHGNHGAMAQPRTLETAPPRPENVQRGGGATHMNEPAPRISEHAPHMSEPAPRMSYPQGNGAERAAPRAIPERSYAPAPAYHPAMPANRPTPAPHAAPAQHAPGQRGHGEEPHEGR